MRVSTNSILNSYKRQLSSSTSRLDEARKRVLSERKFTSGSQDPVGSLKSMKLRTEYQKNEDYTSTIKDQQSALDAVEDAMMQISKQAQTVSKDDVLSALNGTTSRENRSTIATALRNMQQSMLLSANATYDGKYVFSGSDGNTTAFTLSGDKILYRDTAVSDDASQSKLDEMSKENVYVDLGLGVNVTDGKVSGTTAFDTAHPGIAVFGYGKTDEGISKNMFELLGQMADELESDDYSSDRLWELTDVFNESADNLLQNISKVGVQSQHLSTTLDRMESKQLILNTQISDIEDVDFEEAYTDFSWASYAYQAALKVGNTLISNSFIDFMS